MDLIATLLWVGAAGGWASIMVALARPTMRRAALIVAAVLFLPIGVFGILSVGAVFLAASLVCLIVAFSRA